MSRRYEISSIQFAEDGVLIGFMELPTDVRMGGQLAMQHQLSIDTKHPDYAEDASRLMARAQALLANALEDFDESEPVDPEAEKVDPEEEEKGMGAWR